MLQRAREYLCEVKNFHLPCDCEEGIFARPVSSPSDFPLLEITHNSEAGVQYGTTKNMRLSYSPDVAGLPLVINGLYRGYMVSLESSSARKDIILCGLFRVGEEVSPHRPSCTVVL